MPVDFKRDDEFTTASKTGLQKLAGYTSISLAGICAIHCLMIPVLLALFPVLISALLFEEIFHELLLLLIIPLSFLAIFLGCRRHKDLTVFLIVALGLALILIGAFGAEESKETVLTLTGSVVMVAGYVRNFRLCSKTTCEH